jgi:hypothetical protein
MAQAATKKRSSPKGKASAKPSAKKRTSSKQTLTTRPGGPVRPKMAAAAVKKAAKRALPAARDGVRSGLDKLRGVGWDRLADSVRKVPVQRSLDVAVPLEAAWDEWLRFDWVPDGAHTVSDVERDGDSLYGRVAGRHVNGDWEAEIVDEREDQSLAWQTVAGSDTSGLVTFHRLADRLTRIELQLDVVPQGPGEALALALRMADRRAETVMRSFKAQVEALDPDEYPPIAETDEQDDSDTEAGEER